MRETCRSARERGAPIFHDTQPEAAASDATPPDPAPSETAAEQSYVDRLYARLDELRDSSAAELRTVRAAGASGTHAARIERDARAAMLEDRIARFDAVENGLVFGRIDRISGEALYVGRIGISSEAYERLLVDWRAPAARPFYTATPGSAEGLRRRRHLRVRDRRVLGVDDEVFDLARLDDADRVHLSGEAALLAALTEGRTGRMRDIVATIQAEQDRIIRAELPGVLVVQGGPGTGKTAVALHRAAYLLYEHRDRLAGRGVLVVGPNAVFLRYIEQVLPSLGETGVVLATVPELYPGVAVTADEPTPVAAVKGDTRMTQVAAELVKAFQRVPEEPLDVAYGRHRLTVDPELVTKARTKARRSRRPHNQARAIFQRMVFGTLAVRTLRAIGVERPGQEELTDVARDLLDTDELVTEVDKLWPILTPERLLAGLYASADLRDRVARGLSADERAALAREPDHGWTAADVPLLDELARRIGPVPARDPVADRRAEEEREAERFAADTLSLLDLPMPVSAAAVAERYRGPGERRTVAQRAAEDREWTYGHVIVDEAQELSPMAWRMLQRRCPARSMTVVGDLAQASSPWGPESWAAALDEYARGQLHVEELTVNYRTPAEIMAVAGDVLHSVEPDAVVPRSIRSAGTDPWYAEVEPDRLVEALVKAVTDESAANRDGMVGVVVPRALRAELDGALAELVPDLVSPRRTQLDSPAVVLDVVEAKGLEFDSVIVVEPARILAEGERGAHDLYVALSRATKRLGVVHTGALPDAMAR
ncbi:MAG TPA: ATP-binding domain-containing protein [Streptosporangiales bacterium]